MVGALLLQTHRQRVLGCPRTEIHMVFLPFVRVVHRRKLVDLTEERRLQWMAEVRLKGEKQEEEERQERIALFSRGVAVPQRRKLRL